MSIFLLDKSKNNLLMTKIDKSKINKYILLILIINLAHLKIKTNKPNRIIHKIKQK